MSHPVIALIGTGNMGSSLIGGLIKNGHPAQQIIACDPDTAKLTQIQKQFGVRTATNEQAASEADVLIMAVKPQAFANVAQALKAAVQQRKPLILSIAAGVQADSIANWLGGDVAVVRTMPNTPALIGCGATGLYANEFVAAAQRQRAEAIMSAVGITVWVDDEAHMDTVTALSGSGPAYFFLIMEAMQQTAEQLGLSADTARLLTLQTALGATQMALASELTLEQLRLNVTSPGGTTEKAISVLEEHNIRDIFRKALHGAKVRSEELAKLSHQ